MPPRKDAPPVPSPSSKPTSATNSQSQQAHPSQPTASTQAQQNSALNQTSVAQQKPQTLDKKESSQTKSDSFVTSYAYAIPVICHTNQSQINIAVTDFDFEKDLLKRETLKRQKTE